MSEILVEMSYYRKDNPEDIKKVIIKETQADDIKRLLAHIHVLGVRNVPATSIRDYLLP